jgi:SAM-dependent methyltransferase
VLKPPLPWIARHLPLIPAAGLALDLAAGRGRHTAALRAAGLRVVAVDRDVATLEAGFAGDLGCRIVALDLETGAPWALGGGYDGIVVAHYLHRPLLPDLVAALAPGGALIYETFMDGNERHGKPSNPDFLLRPNELIDVFSPALTIVAFEQGLVEGPRSAVVQRLAAVKGPVGRLL